MDISYTLKYPVTLATGETITEIKMRRATAADRLAVEGDGRRDGEELLADLFANLSGIGPEVFQEMDREDSGKLSDAFDEANAYNALETYTPGDPIALKHPVGDKTSIMLRRVKVKDGIAARKGNPKPLQALCSVMAAISGWPVADIHRLALADFQALVDVYNDFLT